MVNNTRGTDTLTSRQLEILELLVAGKTNSEIASELGTPLSDVKTHLVSIMETLGVTSPAAAIEAWRRRERRKKVLKRTLTGGGIIVAVAILSLLALSFLGGSDSDLADDDIRVLIVTILAPKRGFRVLELPSGKEKVLANYAVVEQLHWSPTKEDVIVEFVGSKGQYAFVEYETRTTTTVNLNAPGEDDIQGGRVVWSPDGEMVVIEGGSVFDEQPVYLFHSNGSSVGAIGPNLFADGFRSIAPGSYSSRGCPGITAWTLDSQQFIVTAWESRPRIISRDGLLVITVTSLEMCDDLRPRLYPEEPPVYPSSHAELQNIESRVPNGYRALEATKVWGPGWAASFERPGEPDSQLTLISVEGRNFEFQGTIAQSQVLVLGIEPQPVEIPEIDVSGCPVEPDNPAACKLAVHNVRLLLEGDLDGIMELAWPRMANCLEPSSVDDAVCLASASGLPQATFSVRNETGTTRFVSEFEFQLILGELSNRVSQATVDSSDEYGNGSPRIIGFTCGPWESGSSSCDFPAINASWMEEGPNGPERIVVGLSLIRRYGQLSGLVFRGPDSGYELALTGGEVQPGSTLTRRKAFLWTPPAAN